MSAPANSPRVALVPLIFVLIGVAILCGLGVWQVFRLQEKTHLLARIAALQNAPPEPLTAVLNRIGDRGEVDYTHVVFTCRTLEQTSTERVYTVGDNGAGDRIVAACPLGAGPYRSILVDRGFLSAEDAARLKPSGATVDVPVVGVIRKGGSPSALTPKHEPRGEWFARDVPGLAAALHAPDPAPVFLFLESPKPKGFGPTPAAVPIDIPNNHLSYAITWFGLALSLVGVYIATLISRRRKA